MSEKALERARAWMRADRPAQAARELTEVLAGDPENTEGHALLALSLASMGRHGEATAAARRAVGLAPDSAFTHWVLGTVLCDRDRDKEALVSAREAVRLDPEDPDHHALEAACLAGLSRWKAMRAAAERGLALDPGHVGCLNLRASALRQLGKADAAAGALDVALAENPEDAGTHANYGFACLQRGDVQRALEHFREALRLEPEHEVARLGLVEALKARNPLYRPILWWLLWSSRLSGGRALLFVFGLMFAVKTLSRMRPEAVALQAGILLVVLAYALAMWTSWVGPALFDFLLWVRRDTREVLAPRDRLVAKCTGATVLAAPIAGIFVLVAGDGLAAVLAVMAFLAVAIPVAGGLALENAKARVVGAAIALSCMVLSIGGSAVAVFDGLRGASFDPEEGRVLLGVVLLAIAIVGARMSTWLLLGLGLVKARR